MGLKRSIGPMGLMFSAVSGVLGSAWLFSPFYAAQHAGPASIMAWVLGWLAMLLIAMTFGELVTAFPVAGGNARYLHVTHGPLVGFAFSWLLWLGYSSVAPVETMGVMQYLSSIAPSLTHKINGIPLLTLEGYVIAAVVLFCMCWLNFFGIQWVTRYNSVMVWVKVIIPIVIGLTIGMTAFHANNFTSHGFMPYGVGSVATSLSVGGIIFAFAGYAPAIVLAGEAKNPQKTVPLVLFGALTLCLIVYLLLQITLIGALPAPALTQGWHDAHFSGDTSPVLGLSALLGLDGLRWPIFITAILAPIGTAFIFVATSSRVAYAMSKNGYFPGLFGRLSARSVPVAAVSLNFFVGMLLFFPSPGWQGMVGFLVSAFVLCYGVGPIALLSLRQQAPDTPRPFKLPCHRLWCFVTFTLANLIVYWTGWTTVRNVLLAIALGFIVLILMTIVKRRSWNIRNGLWILVYFACLGLISYLGDFGGKNLFPTGIDDAIIALLSLVILYFAYRSRLKTCDLTSLSAN